MILIGMIICVATVSFFNGRTPQLYKGHVELMESQGMSREGIPLYPEQLLQMDVQLRLSNLGRIATSQPVLRNSLITMRDFGVVIDPDYLVKHTTVEPVKDTNILAIEVSLPNGRDAKTAADVIALEFTKVYSELNNAALRQSREFIEGQITSTRQAMIAAQSTLEKFKAENDIVALDVQSTNAVQRLSDAKTGFNTANANYESARSRTMSLEKELQDVPQFQVVSTQTTRNPLWERLNEQLVQLEASKAGMLNGKPGEPRRGSQHPEVLSLQRQVDDVKAQLQRIPQEIAASRNEALNANYQSLMDRWMTSKVDEVGADSTRRALLRVIDEVRNEMVGLPAKQAKLAELEADVTSSTQTYGLMRSKLDEARIKENQAESEVALKVIEPAYVKEVSQKKNLKLLLALVLSPLLGIAVALLLHYTDFSVRTPKDAEKFLGVPVLAAVPRMKAHSLATQNCPEILEVSYQMLTSSLWMAKQSQGLGSLAVVSADPDVGRSVTASNLAISLAKEGARVILVDADLRQPVQHLMMGVDNSLGLSDLLAGVAVLEDVLVPTKFEGLLLVPSGSTSSNPVKVLKNGDFRDFVDCTQKVADFVIYDTPSGIAFPDSVLISSVVGPALMVQPAGRVVRDGETDFQERLRSAGVEVAGAVLNGVRREDSLAYIQYCQSYAGISTGRPQTQRATAANQSSVTSG